MRTSSEGPDRSAPLEKRAVRSVWSVGGEPEKLTERARRLKRKRAAEALGYTKVCRVSSPSFPDWELEGEEEAERLTFLSTSNFRGIHLFFLVFFFFSNFSCPA